jgi:acylphosphatase
VSIEPKKRIYARVSGSVQGVGFRYFTRRKATELGLGGYVRNMSNGSVELEVEGPKEALDTFLNSVMRGPAGSRVIECYTDERPLRGNRNKFEIRL